MPVLRPCLVLLALATLTTMSASARAASSDRAATVAGTPITRAAYERRVGLLRALPLMNNPMVVPVPPTDAAIDQLVAERVIALEGARRHIRPTASDLMRARSMQRQEYRAVEGWRAWSAGA